MGFSACVINSRGLAEQLGIDENNLKAAIAENRYGGLARIWYAEDRKTYISAKINCSKKNRDTNKYEVDFTGFVNFVGHAADVVRQEIKRGNGKYTEISGHEVFEFTNGFPVQIINCDSSVYYNSESKKTYNNYSVFDCVPFVYNGSKKTSSQNNRAQAPNKRNSHTSIRDEDVYDDDDDDLPF